MAKKKIKVFIGPTIHEIYEEDYTKIFGSKRKRGSRYA